jgi:phosphoribosylformylglycinamidine synthase
VQVQQSRIARLVEVFVAHGFESTSIHAIGKVLPDPKDQSFTVVHQRNVVFSSTRTVLQQLWAETSFQMQSLREVPDCAAEEFAQIADETHIAVLKYELTFTPTASGPPFHRPKVAILREQGVNGHVKMAWAFTAAGFDAEDVQMSDIVGDMVDLTEFRGLAACGGFSYGDVLGAGVGWAHAALLHGGPVVHVQRSLLSLRATTHLRLACAMDVSS